MTASSTLWNWTKYGIFLFALKCTNFAACVPDAPHFLRVKRVRSWYMIVCIFCFLHLVRLTDALMFVISLSNFIQETLSEAMSHKEIAVSASNELT